MGDNGLGQVISWYVCTAATIPFVALRLYTRFKRVGRLLIDDYLVLLSLACLIGDLAIQQHMWNLGLGDPSTASREDIKGIMQMIIPGSTLYVSSLWAIKFALVLFYKSLAAPSSRMIPMYNIAIGALAITYLIIFFDIMFQCYPHNKRWSDDPNYQCSPKASEINYWITIFFNIFTDVMIIILPIAMISRLQIKLKQKLGVTGMFCLGFSVVIASIVRAYYSKKNEIMVTCTVSMIETAIAIIAACLPALRSVLLGRSTTVGSSSNPYGRHYELSSAHRRAENWLTAGQVKGGSHASYATRSRVNGSEETLFSDGHLEAGAETPGKIKVNTQISTTFEDTESVASSSKAKTSDEK